MRRSIAYLVRPLLMLFLMFDLYGCTVYRDLPPEQGVPPKAFRADRGLAPQLHLQDTEYWWFRFGDPLLNMLVQQAFSGNLDLEIALSRLEEADAALQKAGSTLWPRVKISLDAGRTGVGDKGDDHYSYDAFASYEIDLFQRLRNYRKEKRLQQQATREDLKGVILTVSADIASTHFKVLADLERIRLQKNIVRELERTLELVRLRYANGLVSALDVYQASQNLMANRAALPEMEKDLETSLNALAILLGKTPEGLDGYRKALMKRIDSSEMAELLPALDFRVDPGSPASVIQKRPDVQAAYLRLYAQDRKVAQAMADLLPRLDLSFGINSDNFKPRNLLDYERAIWKLLGSVTQPVFQGGELLREADIQRARLKKAAAEYHKAVLAALKEVEDAMLAENAIRENLKYLERRRSDLKNSAQISIFRYSFGLSDFLPVLQAQTSFQSVAQEMVAKRYLLILSQITLARVAGGHWMDKQAEAMMKERRQ